LYQLKAVAVLDQAGQGLGRSYRLVAAGKIRNTRTGKKTFHLSAVLNPSFVCENRSSTTAYPCVNVSQSYSALFILNKKQLNTSGSKHLNLCLNVFMELHGADPVLRN
jgi:hypothetical protein